MKKTLNFYPHNTQGKLITFCGLDGCGKSTMIRKLDEYLTNKGRELFLTKQPTDFVRKSAIFRTYMDSPVHDNYDYRSLSLLAASDRVQHTNRVILPELKDGKTVISDRYFYSCLANLRARGYEDDVWIYDVASSIVKPDLAVFLDTSVETAVARVRSRSAEKERYIDMDLQYKLRDQYRKIAEENECLIVSSEMDEEKTWSEIRKAVDKLFGENEKSEKSEKCEKVEENLPAKQMVLNLLCELSGKEKVDENVSLEALGLDSLDMVTMLVTIEDKAGIELAPEDMNPFDLRAVQDVIALAEKYKVGILK